MRDIWASVHGRRFGRRFCDRIGGQVGGDGRKDQKGYKQAWHLGGPPPQVVTRTSVQTPLVEGRLQRQKRLLLAVISI